MENIFMQGKRHSSFSWADLGDIAAGRGDLGPDLPVLVYRLMQYTMLDAITADLGEEAANGYFKKAGALAGAEFARNVLDLELPVKEFLAGLQLRLRELKICVFRVESLDDHDGRLVITAAQDLDCSGLPVTNETVCKYDEGFFSGIFGAYFKRPYDMVEVDCWANGNRVCRFQGGPA
jgi:predicted hydrocarbon binding protein